MPLLNVIEQRDRSITVLQRDRLIARYRPNQEGHRPFLSELCTSNGLDVFDGSSDGPSRRHGVWMGHDSINGVDFWSGKEGDGSIRHEELLAKISGEDRAIFAVSNHWTDPDGQLLLQDELTYVIHVPVEHGIEVDLMIRLRAVGPDLKFAATENCGFPFVRMAEKLDVEDGGCITNADGMVNEAGTFGKPAAWCDYSGPRANGEFAGLGIYDHPQNPGFPSRWYTRDSGVMAPNFVHFGEEIVLRHGHELLRRFRLFVHDGTALRARVAREHDHYLDTIARGR